MFKKLTALVLTLLLCVAFVGCGDNANTPKDNDTNNEESTPSINDILSNAIILNLKVAFFATICVF